jgi:hypothetical protein
MSSPPAEEVKIRLKHGEWEVEVVCIESRVKQVVESVLSSLDTAKMTGPELQSQLDALRREIDSLKTRPSTELMADDQHQQQQKVATKSGMTCRGLLENLWFEDILLVKGPLVKYMKSYQEGDTTTIGRQSRIRLQIWCEKTS